MLFKFQGDAVLYPHGYTTSLIDDDKYIDIKGDVEESLKNATFKIISVAVEPLHNWYGIVTGTSVDFASSVRIFLTIIYYIYILHHTILNVSHCDDGLRIQSVITPIYTMSDVRVDLWSKIRRTIFVEGEGKFQTNSFIFLTCGNSHEPHPTDLNNTVCHSATPLRST